MLVLLTLVLLLDFPLDTLEVEDGASLGVVEAGRPVEQPQDEGDEDHARHGLQIERSGVNNYPVPVYISWSYQSNETLLSKQE